MREPFGTLPDGREVERLTLAAGGVTARIITFGAALQALVVPDRTGMPDDIVLGHDGLAGYLAHRSFFGATIGRVANRIAGGRFLLDGREVRLAVNEGSTTLHGGPDGWDRRLWQIEAESPGAVRLGLVSPAGDQGFPGRVHACVTYALSAEAGAAVLRITHEAQTDAPTPVAMTHHSFFALAGARGLAMRPRSALDYRLTVAAARYLPVDAHAIPRAPAPVGATPFDFRTGRLPVTAVRSGVIGGYDHCLCLDAGRAELFDPVTGRRMTLCTDQPGLQVYTGDALDGSVRGKNGRAYACQDAICLEPQTWPNAVNMPPGPGLPSPILRPGTPYRAQMSLRFTAD